MAEADEDTAPVVDLYIPERARLAETLCQQPDNLSFNTFCRLRIEATELMVALNSEPEIAKRKRIRGMPQIDAFINGKISRARLCSSHKQDTVSAIYRR
ncbi:hypothetical protein PT974_04927 [Cladobotryum mycophilum]|uniref:Uncharacterized protein n=1 Tax=Cladobotryum mycophilum TaxID=491253 RepID=A0ABR0SQK6_9HYPO